VLSAPSFDAVTRACDGRQILGRPAAADVEVPDVVVAAGSALRGTRTAPAVLAFVRDKRH
jgi:hypothetical protein